MNKTIKIPHDGGLSALNKGAPEIHLPGAPC
jgi:hypothetical protein